MKEKMQHRFHLQRTQQFYRRQRHFLVKTTKCTEQAQIPLDCAPGGRRYGPRSCPPVSQLCEHNPVAWLIFSFPGSKGRANAHVHRHASSVPDS